MTHMQILGSLHIVINRCLRRFGGFLVMGNVDLLKPSYWNIDLENGFSINNVLLLISALVLALLWLSVLQLGFQFKGLLQFFVDFRGKSGDLNHGFCSGIDVGGICYSKILSCKIGLYRFSTVPGSALLEKVGEKKENGDFISNDDLVSSGSSTDEDDRGEEVRDQDDDDDNDEEEEQQQDEEGGEEERELNALRKEIEMERERANAALSELDQERTSAADAADEAMAMILRLQSEKSSIEIEANQYRRMAEQKQRYDQEVIQSLRWMIQRHESERSILLNHLKLCRQKLEQYLKPDEGDVQFEELDQILDCSYSIMEDEFTGSLVSSLDMDSSLL